MTNFKSLGLARPIVRGVHAAGYKKPTQIQAAAIPLACDHNDIIGCAQTGTGKTAAFVLPVLDRLIQERREKGDRFVQSLIIVPTRELAMQVTKAVETYGEFVRFSVLSIYGGVDIYRQTKRLRRGVDIIVATPGRLLDHINRGNIDLSRVKILILDEADRMLDMSGNPTHSPHGEPIPGPDGVMKTIDDRPLADVEAGASYEITRILTRESDRLEYIEALGLTPKTHLEVIHIAPFEGPMQLKLHGEYRIIGHTLAQLIRVVPYA